MCSAVAVNRMLSVSFHSREKNRYRSAEFPVLPPSWLYHPIIFEQCVLCKSEESPVTILISLGG